MTFPSRTSPSGPFAGSAGGVPTLAEVLASGNDAEGQEITGLPAPSGGSDAATVTYVTTIIEAITLEQILSQGSDAGGEAITGLPEPSTPSSPVTLEFLDDYFRLGQLPFLEFAPDETRVRWNNSPGPLEWHNGVGYTLADSGGSVVPPIAGRYEITVNLSGTNDDIESFPTVALTLAAFDAGGGLMNRFIARDELQAIAGSNMCYSISGVVDIDDPATTQITTTLTPPGFAINAGVIILKRLGPVPS